MLSVPYKETGPPPPPKITRLNGDLDSDDDDEVNAIASLDVRIEEDDPIKSEKLGVDKAKEVAASSSSSRLSSLRSLLGVPASVPSARPSASNVGATRNGNPGGLLGVPPSTTARTAPQGVGGASGATKPSDDGEGGRAMLQSEIAPKRKKVVLAPGCSALDWAHKKQILAKQRAEMAARQSVPLFAKISMEELKQHSTLDDAWSVFNGKVYDITPYLRFHPGGQKELMRVAGRDGTRLFMLTHSWVNIDAMIDACCIGFLAKD